MTRPGGIVEVRPPRNTHAHLHSRWATSAAKRPQIGTDIALQYTASLRRSTMRYVALLLLFFSGTASARDNGQWNNSPINIREWFQSLMQPDNPYMSCCGEADAFEADTFEVDGDHYVAVITDGKGVLPSGTRITVPNQKMKWDRGNPTGHGIIFIGNQGQVYCYVAPGGV
jgi:hypothetical protein